MAQQFPITCVSSPSLTFLLSDEVLHNDVSHAVPVGISVLIEPMDCAEYQVVESDGAILATGHL